MEFFLLFYKIDFSWNVILFQFSFLGYLVIVQVKAFPFCLLFWGARERKRLKKTYLNCCGRSWFVFIYFTCLLNFVQMPLPPFSLSFSMSLSPCSFSPSFIFLTVFTLFMQQLCLFMPFSVVVKFVPFQAFVISCKIVQ